METHRVPGVCPGSRIRSFMRWRGDVLSLQMDWWPVQNEHLKICVSFPCLFFFKANVFFFLILAMLGLSCHMQDLGCRMCDLQPRLGIEPRPPCTGQTRTPSLPVSVCISLLSFIHVAACRFSRAQSCLTLCDPVDCSTPGLPVHHQLPELAQTHVHRVGDAIQPSRPLSSPSPPAFNLSQLQGLFQ